MQYGYQDNFRWSDHVYVYANQTTTYSRQKVYTKTGVINHTIIGFGDFEETTSTDVYEWVTREVTPSVEVSQNVEELYVQPSSVGIVSETDRFIYPHSSPVGDSDGFDSHTQEQTYTDNPLITHDYYEYTEEEVFGEDRTHAVITSISSAEAAFINDQFETIGGASTAEFMTAQIDKYALQIYNSSMLTKNIFAVNGTKQIRQSNLREIPNIESAFSASVNTNLSDGAEAVLIDEYTEAPDPSGFEMSPDFTAVYGS